VPLVVDLARAVVMVVLVAEKAVMAATAVEADIKSLS
jgi:hypothetical protein